MTLDRRLGAASFVVSLAVLLAAFAPLIPNWFPTGDDWTVIPHAALLTPAAHWTDWFTLGFRDYYDNATLPYYRPLIDAYYWLVWQVLGPHWPAWEILTLVMHAAGVATTTIVARRAYGLGLGASATAGALMLACPAVLTHALTVFSANNELLIAPLAGGAFFLVRSGRRAAAAACLMAALLLKETSVWIVPPAVLTSFLGPTSAGSLARRTSRAAVLMLPLAVYFLLKFGVAAPLSAGNEYLPDYLSGGQSLGHTALEHLLLWPSGFFISPVVGTLKADSRLVLAVVAVSIAVNFYCWLLLAGLAASALSRVVAPENWIVRALRAANKLAIGGRRSAPGDIGSQDAWAPALWAVAGAAFLVVAPTDNPRYGYSEAVFLIPGFLAAAAWRASATLLGATTVAWVAVLQVGAAAPWLPSTRTAAARNFASAIESAPRPTRNLDVVGEPHHVAPFMALLGRPIVVTQLANVLGNCEGPTQWQVTHRRIGNAVDVTLALPGCQIATPSPGFLSRPVARPVVRGANGFEHDLATAISKKGLVDGPRPPGWLVTHGFTPHSRWPAAWRPGSNRLDLHVVVSQPTRFIVLNPASGQTFVWDEAGAPLGRD